MRRGLGRSGAAAALLLAFLVAAPASPAGAAQTITFDQPKPGQVFTEPTVRVSGRVPADLLYKAKDVTLSVKGQDARKFTCRTDEPDCPFSWDVSFPRNGAFEYSVKATTQDLVGLTAGPDIQSPTRTVSVEVPPAKPVLDPPKVNDARNVELTWSRNAEPDLSYYAVFRKEPGAASPTQVGANVKQTAVGTKPSLVDTTTAPFGGGEYTYQVYAVRPGVSKEVVSEPSTARVANVPPPPTTTSTTLPGSAPTAPGATTTTAKPRPPAGVDLSKFLSSRAQPVTLPSITVPEPPDTGFEGTLPFGARPPGEELEEGELEAVPPRDGGRTSSIVSLGTGRPLVPVAGGLVLLLLAFHMRLLNRRVKEAPAGDDLPLEAPPAAATPAPAEPVRAPKAAPAPAPTPTVFDVDAEDGVDEDWAPEIETEWRLDDFEPEPEIEPEPELEEVVTVLARSEPEPEVPSDPDEIEVVDVVSSRRRLVRAGSR